MLVAPDITQFNQPYTAGPLTTGAITLTSTASADLNCNDFTAGPSSTSRTTIGFADYSSALAFAGPGYTFPCGIGLPGFYCLQQ